VRKHDLSTRTARRKLAIRPAVYWVRVRKGRGLGYRRSSKTSPGVWYLRWRVVSATGAKYKWESFATADDLADLQADGVSVLTFDQAFEHAGHFDPESTLEVPVEAATVSACCDAYIEHKILTGATDRAVQGAKSMINCHIRPALGGIKVGMLTSKQIRQWHLGLSEQPVLVRSAKGAERRYGKKATTKDAKRARKCTANKVLNRLKAVLNFAYREELIECTDSTWRRVEPFKGVDTSREGYLKKADAERLLNAIEGDFRYLVAVALHTGARYGELCRLRVEDVHLENHFALIRESKSGKSRKIYLDEAAYDWFARLTAGRSGNEHVLLNGSKPWSRSVQQARMDRACVNAGIDRVTFHQLRHTYASHFIQNGGHLLDLSKQLGHSTTRMVELHYGHLSDEYLRENVQKHAPTYRADVLPNVASIDRAKSA
jgi:integrase